jgi:hypothetical protein
VALVRREFVVNVPVGRAWGHLAQVERWPSWARHIRQVELTPASELGPKSIGVIRYDDVSEAVEEQKTKLTWVVVVEGFGRSVLGRIFAAVYGRNLDRAIPLLVAELQAA